MNICSVLWTDSGDVDVCTRLRTSCRIHQSCLCCRIQQSCLSCWIQQSVLGHNDPLLEEKWNGHGLIDHERMSTSQCLKQRGNCEWGGTLTFDYHVRQMLLVSHWATEAEQLSIMAPVVHHIRCQSKYSSSALFVTYMVFKLWDKQQQHARVVFIFRLKLRCALTYYITLTY